MHSPINVVMKQQRGGAITNAYGHTQTGLQACSRSSLSSCLPANRPLRQQAGLNIIWNSMGLKEAVLWIFDSKMGNKCTIMKRCSIFSIFQRNNFGNKE